MTETGSRNFLIFYAKKAKNENNKQESIFCLHSYKSLIKNETMANTVFSKTSRNIYKSRKMNKYP
jgi:hypothetical protein